MQRQDLITCLRDEVAPEIRRSGDPFASLLKVARDNNFAPAQLEGLGQIYNTAKTLKFFEKSSSTGASRGDSFPLVDVEKLLADYLDVSKEDGRAKAARGQSAYDQLADDASTGLPSCFTRLGPSFLKVEMEKLESEQSVPIKQASSVNPMLRHEMEMVEQIREEFRDKARETMEKIANVLRSTDGYDFTDLDRDAIYVNGDSIRRTMDSLAHYLTSVRVKAARCDGPGPKRLVMDPHGLQPMIADLRGHLNMVSEASLFLKESTATQAKPKDVEQESEVLGGGVGLEQKKNRNVNPAGGGNPVGGKSPSEKPTTFFGGVGDAYQKAKAPLNYGWGKVKSVMGDPKADQRVVDQADLDARHLAVLHNLLTTDDVLAEADPDRVVEVFNSIRDVAPQMAADTNVMRVALRSAMQHEGISPFDIKQFSDTENARQKVNINERLLDSLRYQGRELGVPSKAQ